MPIVSKVQNKKPWIVGGIVLAVIVVLNLGYYITNTKYTPSVVRSSIRLWNSQENEETKQQQIEYNNAFYLQNGYEQGTLDAQCASWACSFNLDIGIMRGKIISPYKRLKINGHSLTETEKTYYNSGYIKGYKQVCSKYRNDCDSKINQMMTDYTNYYKAPLFDANSENHLTLARDVKTKIDGARAYYSIDGGEYTVIDTDKMIGNNNLPVRENVIGRAEVSSDKKFIVLEVIQDKLGGSLYYLVFEIDNKVLHKVNIEPFAYEFVKITWTPDNYLFIQKYGDTPSGRGIVAEYISTDKQKPWEVKQRQPVGN